MAEKTYTIKQIGVVQDVLDKSSVRSHVQQVPSVIKNADRRRGGRTIGKVRALQRGTKKGTKRYAILAGRLEID